ncbi:uncharacterized protein LOC135805483 [Sycon ciliatum]|uniref:uncharacterized protein LOC135805483 n=1 Tax=Sycon ciliatum TaxID=27933 RepID=UPI0031F62EA9
MNSDDEDVARELWPYHVAPLAAGVLVAVVTIIIVRRLRWHASSTYRRMSQPARKTGQKPQSAIQDNLARVSQLCFHPPLTGSFVSAELSSENELRARALDRILPLKKSMLAWLKSDTADISQCALTMRSSLKDIVDLAASVDRGLFSDCQADCQMLCALSQRARFGHEEFSQTLFDILCARYDIVSRRWQAYSDRSLRFSRPDDDMVDGPGPGSPLLGLAFSGPGAHSPISPLSTGSHIAMETSI